VTWSPWNNYLLACVLFVTTVTRCHIGLSGITKHISGMKYVYLIEGILFVCISILVVPSMGFIGLLTTALFCNLGITGTYGVYRTGAFFRIPRLEIVGWVARSAGFMILIAGLFSLSFIPSFSALDAKLQLCLEGLAFGMIAIPSAWFIAINKNIKNEIKIFICDVSRKLFQIRKPV
jgi:hypothetical protein